jgi:hypothetical protein
MVQDSIKGAGMMCIKMDDIQEGVGISAIFTMPKYGNLLGVVVSYVTNYQYGRLRSKVHYYSAF